MRQEITLTLIILVIITTAVILGKSMPVYSRQPQISQAQIPGKATIWVYNGSRRSGLAERVTNSLRTNGFDAYNKGNATIQTYKRTLVISRNGDMRAARAVAAHLGVSNPFFLESDVDITNDITIIVGDLHREPR